jgi:WD40 repeat protein
MARFASLLTLATLLLALPAEGAAPATKMKTTKGWIESLAMDGNRVAYDVQGSTACNELFVWNVRSGGGALVSGKRTCAADSTSTGGGVTAIAVAGKRIAWIVNLGGNTESNDYLYTASLPWPKERLRARAKRTGDISGALVGNWISGLVGGGDRLAVNRWSTDRQNNVTKASLQRIAGRVTTIAGGTSTLDAWSLDLRRIAVLSPDGTASLYDAGTGKVLLTVTPTSAKEVALRKDYLVVLTKSKTLEIYNSHTAALVKKLPVAGGARRLDVHSGIAVYAVGRKVHVLRFSDGKHAVLATAPRAIEGLEIEAPGIVYAYNTVKGIKDVGNLAFVPLAKVTSLLR